ncbi:HTH_48 domain-containing protein [Trichonephila clavipes]|nr:HTH_48 domain-containing protein [Trichonephila clavipes]
MSIADIHRQITKPYGTKAMSDSKVQKWVKKFKGGQTSVHDEERSGRLSIITDDLMKSFETKIHENRRFTITTLSLEFPNVSRSVVYKIVNEDLNSKKLCSRRIVTGVEIWVSHITPESKQQLLEWRNTSSPVKVKAKQTLSKRKIREKCSRTGAECFTSGLNTTRNNDQLRYLLSNSKEAPKSIAKQTARFAVKRSVWNGLFGFRKGGEREREAFRDILEVTFHEKAEPYCDDKIEDLVNHLFDNFTTNTPPLASPSEVRGFIKKLQNRKAVGPVSNS